MARLDPIDLRQRIEARIKGSLPNWSVSSQPYDSFPGADLRDREGLSFAVGLPASEVLPGRQPGQVGGLAPVLSRVGVRFAVSLPSDAGGAGYDAALQREIELVAAVCSTGGAGHAGGPRCAFVGVERTVVGDGTLFVGTLTFQVFHTYPTG